ncbi:hypothetical protein BCR36DRAFT_583359 [Piromyces finnis]|uniref:Uncharacterized protein n=1 Tax=Piromyces finnis TaxID=1754191 RepID=A0A1Y1V9X1_9FUNG|nr:hypothetical protein BCR36DRAFT_583359 [Piromyces finnis]|eukprot:ORX50779.1 hypothetical protein BCR36DRAFT_583359 [Piromyces finnis]
MYNGNITHSLDRNHSLSLFYSRRTPSKAKPIKKQSKFLLPTGENLSPIKDNVITPYNSTTTPILVHSLSDMSLKNDTNHLEPDDSPTPASRYSIIKPNVGKQNINNNNLQEKSLPLYPNSISQKLNNKSNINNKDEDFQNMLTLPKFQRRTARMAVVVSERKPVNLFTNQLKEEKNKINNTLELKNEISNNEKSKMNLDEQNTNLDNCPHSEGFLNSDGIWEDPTLSQSESRCLQTTMVDNIMKTNENYESVIDKNNNDKMLMWDFEEDNKFNDKENIIPDDYKGGILAEREWCDLGNDDDSIMEEYDDLSKSTLQKGKKQSNGMIKKSENQHVRYAFQEISINSMPEYQMNSTDCYSVYSNSSFGSACDSQFMNTPKKYFGSYKMNNSFSNSLTNNSNIDNNDSTPSFFNTLPLKTMKVNASSSSTNPKKIMNTKKIVYQLCGVPDINAVHKRSIAKSKGNIKIEKKGLEIDNPSFMNSSPIISKSSILSPSLLLSSPFVRNGFSSPLVQTNTNYYINPPRRKKIHLGDNQNNELITEKDTISTLVHQDIEDDTTPKPPKVKSLLSSSFDNNNLSSSECKSVPVAEKIASKENLKILESSQTNEKEEETVFFPHYHSKYHNQANDKKLDIEEKIIADETFLSQTSSMMSISPSTLSKINETHQSFLQLNQNLDIVAEEASANTSINLPRRNRISVEDKKKELLSRRKSRIKKYVF